MGLSVAHETDRDAERGPETPVWIWQRTWEFERLLDLYRERKPARVLELGTFHGGTLYHWLANAAAGALVMTVDSGARDPVPADWVPGNVKLVTVEDSTLGARGSAAALGPWDWIFIDADHRDAPVRADWDAYLSLAAPGSVVVLHDILPTADPSIQVDRLWRDIQQAGYVTQELIADPAAEWGGIGIVYL